MNRLVVDASVVLKWVLPETHAAEARLLLGRGLQLLAPDLLFAEVGNALWKCVLRGEMSGRQADALLQVVGRAPLEIRPHWPLVRMAMEIACRAPCSVYDGLYVALAAYERAPLVTADRKLYAAVSAGPLAEHVMWVGDLV